MPKVSVIIPNYNHARFLARRLETVLGQSYSDLEVIFLDDASTDESREVFAPFAGDRRVRAIFNRANSGSPFAQWNRGVEEATGTYVWVAESDDFADADLLRELVKRLETHSGVGLAYTQSWAVDAEGEVVSSLLDWTDGVDRERWRADYVNNGRDEVARFLVLRNTIPNASAVLFRRSLYRRLGGADPRLRLCGDWLLWMRLALESDIAFVARPLNYFRTHGATARATLGESRLGLEESYRVLQYILSRVAVTLHVREKACRRIFDGWLAMHGLRQLPLRHNWALYRRARAVDPWLNRRVATTVLRELRGVLPRPW